MKRAIQAKLDQLADFHARRDALRLQKAEQHAAIVNARQDRIAAVLPPEIVKALNEIDAETEQQFNDLDAEYDGREEAVNANISALEAEIKEAVKIHGASVKGSFLHAVFTKGRVSWDTRALEGYAATHPEIIPFKKTGEPSVSIRAAK